MPVYLQKSILYMGNPCKEAALDYVTSMFLHVWDLDFSKKNYQSER